LLPAAACSAYNKAMAAEPQEAPNFETSIAELEALVKELERGDLPLEKSLDLFERGMKLSDQCRKQLAAAETKVEMLIKRGSETVPAPFDEGKG
jgi:exodeoxyribonuclease VII small subunit